MGYRARAGCVGAKTKAMYGMRLTDADYDEMIQANSVWGVTSYLKSHPLYSNALADLTEATIGRALLETLIRGTVVSDYKKIEFYLSDADRQTVKAYLQRGEIDFIIGIIIKLRNKSGTGNNQITATVPQAMDMNYSEKILSLVAANSFSELKAILGGTKYAGVLDGFDLERSETVEIEQALCNEFYRRLFKTVTANYGGFEARELKKHIGMRVDLENVRRLIRMRRFGAHKNPEKYYLDFGYRIKLSHLTEAANSARPAEVLEKIGPIYGEFYRMATEGNSSDAYRDEIFHKLDKITLRMSRSAAASAIAYVGIKNNEIKNLYHIIESKKYGIPPDKIRQNIIGYSSGADGRKGV